MTDQQTSTEQSARASTADTRWIELNALQRDLLELLYRQAQQTNTDNAALTDAAIHDEFAEWYGDVVPDDSVESVLANLVDRSLVRTLSAEDEETGVEYALTSASELLVAGRVVSLASLLTDDERDTDDAVDSLEGQS